MRKITHFTLKNKNRRIIEGAAFNAKITENLQHNFVKTGCIFAKSMIVIFPDYQLYLFFNTSLVALYGAFFFKH